MRTNLPFSYIVDIASQALPTVYGLDVEVTRKYSVRGAIEAADLYNDFMDTGDVEKCARAKAIIGALAKELQVPDAVIEQKLRNVSSDSYINFLREIWR